MTIDLQYNEQHRWFPVVVTAYKTSIYRSTQEKNFGSDTLIQTSKYNLKKTQNIQKCVHWLTATNRGIAMGGGGLKISHIYDSTLSFHAIQKSSDI